ncbi:amidase [Psychrosphaera sp.]|nr:amidase [Psychrosphaera sp.]
MYLSSKKRHFKLLAVATLAALYAFNTSAKPIDAKTLEELTSTKSIVELQELMKQGVFSSKDLTQFYIDKIKRDDHKYNSVIALNPSALAIAEELDNRRNELTKKWPLLHGMPILLKDNIEAFELPTTAGSLVLANNKTNRDATLTENLRASGAVILGKTNLSEWANFRSERSSSGWSAIGGQTKNPHDVTRTPCGSSSGSGAAVAANFAIAAIGTETNGSITCPAAVNGVVGIKPTVGLVSRFGVVPISPAQDTAGPMAKSVEDARRVLMAMQGPDVKDTITQSESLIEVIESKYNVDLKKIRLGVIDSGAESHEQVKELSLIKQQKLKEEGVTLVSDLSFETYDGFWNDGYKQLLREFKTSLNHYFANLPGDAPNDLNSLTLASVIEFNKKNSDKEMKYFQQEIFVKSQETAGMNTDRYRNLRKKLKRVTGKEGIDALLKKHNLDALIAITRGPAWKIDKINGDHSNGGVSTFSAISGYPHVTISLGKLHGLPIGLSVMTSEGQDNKAINIAEALEKVL